MKIKLLTDNILVRQIAGLLQFKKSILMPLVFLLVYGNVRGQTNPAAQTLPYTQNFGTAAFSAAPTGMAVWGIASVPTTTALAESSTANSNQTISSTAPASGGSGGAYGHVVSTNARLTILQSGSASGQPVVAINTTGATSVNIAYDLVLTIANARDVGVVLQYRNGTSGAFTTISGSAVTYNSGTSNGGDADGPSDFDSYSFSLPAAALGQSVVQIRWATWRGSQSGSSSGIGLDNINITKTTSPTLNAATLGSAITSTYGSASATGINTSAAGTSLSGNITVTPNAGFEVSSTNATTGFSSSAISVASGTNNIWVRFANNKAAGTYNGVVAAVLSGGGAASNANITTSASGNVVSKATPAISGTGSATNITLGQTLASSTISGFNASVPGTFAFTTPSTTPANAGTASYGVTFTPTDTASYNNATTNVNVTTLPATPTVTATGTTTYTYNGSPQGPASATNTGNGSSYTYSYSGTENGGATYAATATRPTNAGSYEVIATVAATSNYNTASSAPLAFTINKANSTVTVTGDSFYAFDGNPQGPVTYDHTGSAGAVTFHYTGINGTDYPENTTRPTAVGSYKAVATLAANNNYNDAVSADFNYQITSVAVPEITSPLTWSTTYGVAATPYTVVASNNPTSFGVSGLPAGLNYSSLTNEITGTPTAAPGDYNVSLTATNEGGTSDPVTLVVSVDKKTVTVSDASVANKVYNGNNTATLTGTADGFVSGDDVSLVLSAHFDDTSGNVGQAKPVTSTSTLTGTKAAYYNLIQPTGLSADITKATPTVTATGTTTYTYNGLVQGPASATVSPSAAGTATYSYSGTESEGAVYGPSSTRPVNAGTYYMVATVEESANYNAASSSDYAFTIAKANQALTGFGSNITKLSTDAPFNLPAAVTTTGGQAITYAITDMPNAGVATVSGNTVTITGIGTTGITAHADATPNYNAYDASVDLTINWNNAITPTAFAATNILSSGFFANWNSLLGATGYEIDVYTKIIGNDVTADYGFEGSTSVPSGWTNSNSGSYVQNNSTNANTGTYYAGFNVANGYIRTALINNPKSISFYYRYSGSGANNTVKVQYSSDGTNWTDVNSYVATGSGATTSYISTGELSLNLTGSYYIQWVMTARNGGSFYFDDVSITAGGSTTNTPIAGSPFTISSENPQPVNYSHSIINLDRDTDYYYVVRAVNENNKTDNSNEIAVKTTNTVVWDGSNWSNSGVGPDETLDAEITGNYSIASGFEAKNLTISDTGLLTIQPNQGVTINGDITMPDDKIIIESDGSLVQTKLTNGNSDNKAIAKRTVTMRTADFTFWSSPLAGQALLNTTNGNADNSTGGFSEGTPNSRTYHYNEPDDTFRATSDTSFVPGKGYAIRGKSTYGADLSPDELGFRGNLNNGNISIQVKKSKNTTKNGETYEHGYNMIGNPYPSHIDFIDFYNLDKGDGEKNSDVIFGKAWFWSNITVAPSQQGGSSYNANNYAILSLAGSSPATGIDTGETSGNPMPNEFIKVGQGFIVQVRVAPPTNNTPILKTLKFDNSIRTNDNTGHFYNSKSNSTIDRYWVKLTSPNSVVNTILVAHMNAATDAYDADYDAELLSVGDDSFYSKLNAQKLQIQARKRFQSNEDVISVGTKYAVNGTYKISLGQKEGVFSGSQNVYLKDNLLNKTVNLSEGDYAFQAVKGTDDTRFEIVYKDSGVLGADTVKKSDFTVYKDGNSYVIISSKKLGRVDVYDAAGRLLKTFKTNDSYLRIDGSGLSNGVYVIKAENSGDIKTKKIIK
ncbi:YDG domain-containing protein [Epilithonimonas mollis]|uniref:Por secretion system C-terminal sorting domain-containing protein n=1 Tax=Epilithonimonas mollis TaxID=216903 RepID=A0A1M6SBA2_9FLAO|nr:YDG domain-containing protein [Epilithonimonas mollis]SHK41985.1 Por secretion system C-terminal sorting domain-containing protein [Epilithonimonas mollis]